MNKKIGVIDIQIKMICAASRVLLFLKHHPKAIDEEIFQDLSDYIAFERIKDEKIIRGMMAAASKTLAVKRKQFSNSDKLILREVIELISPIALEINTQ